MCAPPSFQIGLMLTSVFFQSGPEYFVEIDVVMPGDTPLWKAHDVAQQLQDKIEVLPNVGRAFVHVDHETDHTPVRRIFTHYPHQNVTNSSLQTRNIESILETTHHESM